MNNLAIIDAAIGAVADAATFAFRVYDGKFPMKILASGLSTGESIEIQSEPFDGAGYAYHYEGGSIKALTADDNVYTLPSPGTYQLVFQGNANAANAAALKVGIQR